jgi:hypothetical protein
VLVPTHPLHTKDEIADIVHNINAAARVALGRAGKDEVDVRGAAPVDVIKYDTKQLAW